MDHGHQDLAAVYTVFFVVFVGFAVLMMVNTARGAKVQSPPNWSTPGYRPPTSTNCYDWVTTPRDRGPKS